MKKNLAVLDKDEIENIVKQSETTECYIIVEKTGKLIRRMVETPDMPTDSIPRDYGAFTGNLLGLDLNNELWAIEPPVTPRKGKHPSQYFSYQGIVIPLVQRAIKLPGNLLEKIKIGLFIGLVMVELIMLFLIVASMGGA